MFGRLIAQRAFASRSSILVLAGFLIGLSFADFLRPELRDHVLKCGVVGMIAFVGLHFVAARREKESTKRLLEIETERVQQLMLLNLKRLKQSLHTRIREIVEESGTKGAGLGEPAGKSDDMQPHHNGAQNGSEQHGGEHNGCEQNGCDETGEPQTERLHSAT